MGYPVPTLSQLSTFSGRPESTYLAFTDQALAQATLLFSLQTGMTVPPEDENLSSLALNAILQMADSLYLAQPYVPLKAKPFQSETIGSYSYSMGSGQFRESISFLKAQVGHYTGLIWWDLAMREFGDTLQTESSSVQVFERDPVVWFEDSTGQRFVKGPSDIMPADFPFDINADVGFTDPSGTRG